MYLIHRSKHRKSSKNEKTEEYASNERTSQNLRKKKQITKLPAKHFKLKKKKKLMITEMFTNWRKRWMSSGRTSTKR